MNHPKPEQWSDYVRGILGSEAAAGLKRHLAPGCRKCERQINSLERVLRVAQTDLRIEPPVAALRAAKSLFRIQNLLDARENPARALDLSFDSCLFPVQVGVRAPDMTARHLVFRSSRLVLDLELDGGDAGEPLRIRGQLLDCDSNPIAEVPAFLLEGGRIHSQDLSGSLGDFTLLGDPESTQRLCLLLDDDLVDVRLPRLSDRRGLARTH